MRCDPKKLQIYSAGSTAPRYALANGSDLNPAAMLVCKLMAICIRKLPPEETWQQQSNCDRLEIQSLDPLLNNLTVASMASLQSTRIKAHSSVKLVAN